MADYTAPVKQLLEIGEVKPKSVATPEKWIDYVQEYQLSESDIPELIRMATDSELNNAEMESKEVWAPLHAWRALAQLQAKDAIEPLMKLFELDDDYVWSDLPSAYGFLGIPAIEPLTEYLADRNHSVIARNMAAEALVKIGNQDEAARHLCVSAIANQLSHYVRQNPEFNGLLVAALVDLNAVEAAETIETAYAAGCVDETIEGSWNDVQARLGLIPYSELQNLRQEEATRPLVDFSVAAAKSSAKLKQSGGGFGGGGKKKKKKK